MICVRCLSEDHIAPQYPWSDVSAKRLKEEREQRLRQFAPSSAKAAAEEAPKREPRVWQLPETDDDIHEFCTQLPTATRRTLYRHLHQLGERI